MPRPTKGTRRPKAVKEARAIYLTDPGLADAAAWTPIMDSKLSSKNQITLPMAMTRQLDWRAGDELNLMLHGDMIVLTRLPRTDDEWVHWVGGTLDVPEWRTKEGIDTWLKSEREGWERDRA